MREHRSRRRLGAGLLAGMLAGCVTTGPQQAAGDGAASPVKQTFADVASAVLAPLGINVAPAGTPAAPPVQALPRVAPRTPPLTTRQPGAIQQLFAKGTVTGADLALELKAVRELMKTRRSPAAVGQLMGSLDGAAAAAGAPDLKERATTALLDSAERQLKSYVRSISFGSLDDHFGELLKDPQELAKETIRLPDAKGLNAAQMQRVVTMAAVVVATRITGRVLTKARQDFDSIESEYGELIARREAAARLLYGALAEGGAGAEAAAAFDRDDLVFLRANVGRMSLADFSADLGAQNLALKYLRRRDPAAFEDYRARSGHAVKATQGYVRTAAGTLAFGALLAEFGQETAAALRGKQAAEMLALLPFAFEFLTETPKLVQLVYEAGAKGVFEVPFKSTQRFRIVDDAGASEALPDAAAVFAALKKRDAEPVLKEALFRNGNPGLLHRLYLCDRTEAGRLLDVAVPVDEREQFAGRYLGSPVPRFSFANTFETPGSTRQEQELGDELLRLDHRERSADPTRALADVQKQAGVQYVRWTNEQLMRLVFANREGAAAQATLQLGAVSVRPIPNAQSIYAYEALVDGCRSVLERELRAAAPPKPAATRPAAPPQPTRAPRAPAKNP
jgi:hypothetical protein